MAITDQLDRIDGSAAVNGDVAAGEGEGPNRRGASKQDQADRAKVRAIVGLVMAGLVIVGAMGMVMIEMAVEAIDHNLAMTAERAELGLDGVDLAAGHTVGPSEHGNPVLVHCDGLRCRSRIVRVDERDDISPERTKVVGEDP